MQTHIARAWSGAASTLRPSARGRDEQRAATSLLHQSDLHGGCNCRNTLHVLCWGRQALSTRVPEAKMSTHRESASALTPSNSRKLASLVGFMVAAVARTHRKCFVKGGKHSPPECQRQTRARILTPPPHSQRRAARIMLHGGCRCQNTLHVLGWW